ncbi:DNA-binding transcriptional LysR family regulator [Paracoccus pantotrophus]|uniref:DNA-binding transcriptional LysR family regulator n=1 Tax=Paracoccus pantotrophus TaxID=82367 RepID=A0AAE6NWU9_PARPN|nr:LysR family transcriptional regulator [Paracoccus pantotrophus]QFG37343.1 LysR family transcriptional regulator [Paracoccus pantotrophus]RKS52219.1 DNA-binding transcriptional LysR family regulator [Paracoccus pantotrophus]
MSRYRFNLKHIEAFLEVADQGTFRRAAERLATTQPNISNRIAQLEDQIGHRLMERDAGSVQLTPRGQALLEPARALIAAADTFVVATGDETKFQGILRLGISEMVAHSWLRQFLREMKVRFPQIDVDLTIDMSANLSRALFDRDLDLTLQNAPFDRVARQSVELGQTTHYWVASPDLGFRKGTVGAKELASHAILTHSRNSRAYQQIAAHFQSINQPVRLVSSSYMGSCLQMALDGLGVACLPAAMLDEALSEQRLICVDYAWRPENLAFFARYLVDPAPPYLSEAVAIAHRLFPPRASIE